MPWRAKSTAEGTSAESIPTNSAIGTVAAEREAEEQRELHVAHPHPARVGEGGEQQEERGAEAGGQPTRPTGGATVCATSTIAAAGRTMRFGTIRRSMSIAERTTSDAQKNEAIAGVAR